MKRKKTISSDLDKIELYRKPKGTQSEKKKFVFFYKKPHTSFQSLWETKHIEDLEFLEKGNVSVSLLPFTTKKF